MSIYLVIVFVGVRGMVVADEPRALEQVPVGREGGAAGQRQQRQQRRQQRPHGGLGSRGPAPAVTSRAYSHCTHSPPTHHRRHITSLVLVWRALRGLRARPEVRG